MLPSVGLFAQFPVTLWKSVACKGLPCKGLPRKFTMFCIQTQVILYHLEQPILLLLCSAMCTDFRCLSGAALQAYCGFGRPVTLYSFRFGVIKVLLLLLSGMRSEAPSAC